MYKEGDNSDIILFFMLIFKICVKDLNFLKLFVIMKA